MATNAELLKVDARNRALRTFLQALGIDVGVALALVLYTTFTNAQAWGDLNWSVVGFLLSKTVIVSAASYVMRAYLDKSSVPTPLPPEPVAEPADPVDE